MPFNWMDYITIGKKLSTESEAASLRTGISRGYYGLFNLLRIQVGFTTKYRPHKEVIDKLALAELYDEQAILSKWLQDLKENRQYADYDGLKNIDQNYSNRFWYRLDKALEVYLANK